jgi:beta-lactamase class A
MVNSFTWRRPLAPLAAFALILLLGCTTSELSASPPVATNPSAESSAAVNHEFAQLEQTFDARLGVYALDVGTGQAVAYRSDERFAFASTSKALLAVVVVQTTSDDELNRVVRYSASDLVDYSPVTQNHVAEGMTLRAVGDA